MTRLSFAIGIAAAALSIVPAAAADLSRFPPAARFYPPPPPLLRVYNWTGCYLGAQLGGAFADNHLNGPLTTTGNFDPSLGGIASFTTAIDQNAGSTAVIAGGQAGCDLQFARNWVIGAQIDGAWTHLNGSQAFRSSAGLPEQGSISLSANTIVQANVLATATGRIGYAVNFDQIAGLFYLKGGVAFAKYDSYGVKGQTSTISCLDGAAFDPTKGCQSLSSPTNIAVNFSAPPANQWGWTIGLGTEWVVDGNWSIFGEWDYLNFGTHNLTFTDVNSGSSQLSVKQSINELKLGINYRFGNPLPGQYP